MEQIREYLNDTGFIQPHVIIDSIDFENLILKPGQDRMELMQWCLSEVDDKLGAKLLHIRGDELDKELLTLTRKLGLSSNSKDDRDTVMGLGGRDRQIPFWQQLLNIVKCVQQENKLQAEKEFKTLQNTSKMWCELLQIFKCDSSRSKMNLIPIKLKIGAQLKTGSFASTIVKEKDSLNQRLQAMKDEESRDIGLLDMAVLNICGINISAADMEADAEKVKELCTKLNLKYQDELTSQPQLRPSAQNQEAEELKNTIEQVNTFSQTQHFAKMVVNGFESAVHSQHNEDGHHENLTHEMFKCYKFLAVK